MIMYPEKKTLNDYFSSFAQKNTIPNILLHKQLVPNSVVMPDSYGQKW